ncbi:MAG: hypothetical protein A4E19_04480 [Nitrospira sp. SG-bin1]|nr:MAG: hypothetical protein A4E19_04480 [Nitrospira sp. SG-bin1]
MTDSRIQSKNSRYLFTGSIQLLIMRYSVSSAPSMHTSHWSNSKVPCSLQKYRRQRLHVMKVILTRSSASHRSHWPALRALGIAMSPQQVVLGLRTSFHDVAIIVGSGPRPPHQGSYTDNTWVFVTPIQNRPALVRRITIATASL